MHKHLFGWKEQAPSLHYSRTNACGEVSGGRGLFSLLAKNREGWGGPRSSINQEEREEKERQDGGKGWGREGKRKGRTGDKDWAGERG